MNEDTDYQLHFGRRAWSVTRNRSFWSDSLLLVVTFLGAIFWAPPCLANFYIDAIIKIDQSNELLTQEKVVEIIVNGTSQGFEGVEDGHLHVFWPEREDMGARMTIRITYKSYMHDPIEPFVPTERFGNSSDPVVDLGEIVLFPRERQFGRLTESIEDILADFGTGVPTPEQIAALEEASRMLLDAKALEPTTPENILYLHRLTADFLSRCNVHQTECDLQVASFALEFAQYVKTHLAETGANLAQAIVSVSLTYSDSLLGIFLHRDAHTSGVCTAKLVQGISSAELIGVVRQLYETASSIDSTDFRPVKGRFFIETKCNLYDEAFNTVEMFFDRNTEITNKQSLSEGLHMYYDLLVDLQDFPPVGADQEKLLQDYVEEWEKNGLETRWRSLCGIMMSRTRNNPSMLMELYRYTENKAYRRDFEDLKSFCLRIGEST